VSIDYCQTNKLSRITKYVTIYIPLFCMVNKGVTQSPQRSLQSLSVNDGDGRRSSISKSKG